MIKTHCYPLLYLVLNKSLFLIKVKKSFIGMRKVFEERPYFILKKKHRFVCTLKNCFYLIVFSIR